MSALARAAAGVAVAAGSLLALATTQEPGGRAGRRASSADQQPEPLVVKAVGRPADLRPLTGFSPDDAAWEREFERRLAELPDPARCGRTLRELTRTPHLAGTPGSERVIAYLADEYRKAGLDVEIASYEVLLSYPKKGQVIVEGEPSLVLPRREEPIPGDPDTDIPEAAIAWNAYAASGDVTAEVVYVNHGAAADYDRLAELGVDVKGKIALARYFGGYRGGKLLEGEKRGVAAMIVYSDPIDDGWFQGDVYPKGPWGPSSHFQRGGAVYDFRAAGDPLTPGWASTPGAKRIAESESELLPKLPMLPLSGRDAAELLSRLGGPAVAEGWQGVAMNAPYHTGPGPLKVRLVVENTRERRTIRNVIATLRGTDEPARKVILSNHHDAWVYGAVDPSSGTTTLLELARALGKLKSEGWQPRRTLVFGAWDAEEYTLTGSTEWGEEHEGDLMKNGVACVNVDASASGRDFSASASPLLARLLREVAADVEDPGVPRAPGGARATKAEPAKRRTVADLWREAALKKSARSYATGGAGELPVSVLGSGSDYTVFFNRLGIPSADLIFDGPYGVYHSVYDSYRWMETVGDPGFLYHAAMARYAGIAALRLANADIYPFEPGAYGRAITRYVEDLPGAAELGSARGALIDAATRWSREADAMEKSLHERLSAWTLSPADVAAANEWLLSLERVLLAPEGIPGRPWFRHLVYAPLPSYAAETLPGIREALVAHDLPRARAQAARLTRNLEEAAAQARKLKP